MQRLRQRPLFDDGLTEALRDFFEAAEYLMVDVQGRIRIGDELLAFAQLDDRLPLHPTDNRVLHALASDLVTESRNVALVGHQRDQLQRCSRRIWAGHPARAGNPSHPADSPHRNRRA